MWCVDHRHFATLCTWTVTVLAHAALWRSWAAPNHLRTIAPPRKHQSLEVRRVALQPRPKQVSGAPDGDKGPSSPQKCPPKPAKAVQPAAPKRPVVKAGTKAVVKAGTKALAAPKPPRTGAKPVKSVASGGGLERRLAQSQILNTLSAVGKSVSIPPQIPNSREDETFQDRVVALMERELQLPDGGEVLIALNLSPQGQYLSHTVLRATSRTNQRYLESALPQLRFPRSYRGVTEAQSITLEFNFCP